MTDINPVESEVDMTQESKSTDFPIQSWGYGAGLLSAPIFFLFSYRYGENVGLIAAGSFIACLIIAELSNALGTSLFRLIRITFCAGSGCVLAVATKGQSPFMLTIFGVFYLAAVYGLCLIRPRIT
jgi:hypothetical protein